jgi:CRP/FNR family transcriptional regulator, cyclic AMP receptor protein
MTAHAELLSKVGTRVRAISAAPPFTHWPPAALHRLAQAALPVRYAAGAVLYRKGEAAERAAIVVAGSVESSMSSFDGRRIVFKLDTPGRTYALVSLIDGEALTHDMVFLEPGLTLEIPFAAVHAELAADPALWEPVARLVNARGRYYIEQMRSFLLDALPSRAASLLLGLLEPQHRVEPGPATIGFRLTQERFAEMLGVTRQAVTPVLRSFARDGLLSWRYGRVTLLDRPRLGAVANSSVHVEPPAGLVAMRRQPRAG